MKIFQSRFGVLCLAVFALANTPMLVLGQTNTFPSSGSVGIGTTSPAQLLHLKGGNAWAVFERGSSSNVAIASFADSGNIPQWALGLGDSSDNFSIFNYATNLDALTILPGGNVGIGITNPSQALEVVGNIRTDGNFMAYGSGQLELQFYNTGDSSDQHFTELIEQGGTFTGRFVNDSYSAASNWISVTRNSGTYTTQYVAFPAGNVGIGTSTPDQKLSVNGTIHAQEVIIDNSGWPDYVFADGHRLTPLSEVERTIKDQKHLPGMPSAQEVAAHGISVGAMQAKLLAQIEELTLRQIAQEQEIANLKTANVKLQSRLAEVLTH